MKDSLLQLIQALVDNPDKVTVKEEPGEFDTLNLLISVDPTDMGKIIGKQGKIIKALRSLIRVISIKEGKKYNLVLLEVPQTA